MHSIITRAPSSRKLLVSSNLFLPKSTSSAIGSTCNSTILQGCYSSICSTTTIRWHGGGSNIDTNTPTVQITFINPHPATSRLKNDNSHSSHSTDSIQVDARVGETLLQTAHRYDIDLEGACEGVCACSTCHLIFEDEEMFDSLPEASEDEEDMLDMAFGLTATSRLGCQIKVTEDMNHMKVRLPAATRNFYVDGHVPQPH